MTVQPNWSDSSLGEESLDRESESDEAVSEEEDEVCKETHDGSPFATVPTTYESTPSNIKNRKRPPQQSLATTDIENYLAELHVQDNTSAVSISDLLKKVKTSCSEYVMRLIL
ncbi:hypothetical protein Tco_1083995 [Tanacetum coccineum]